MIKIWLSSGQVYFNFYSLNGSLFHFSRSIRQPLISYPVFYPLVTMVTEPEPRNDKHVDGAELLENETKYKTIFSQF